MYKNILIGTIITFFILAIVCFFLKKDKKGLYLKLWNKLFNFFTTNVFIGIVLFFFNKELIPFFSARFWYVLWAIGMVVWIGFIIKYLKSLPEKRKQMKETKEYKKYIP
jgi:amino acid transporter